MDSPWIDVSHDLPFVEISDRGILKKSRRCIVVINNRGQVYESFAYFTKFSYLDCEWVIDGHNGDWSSRVTHWMYVPELP